MRINAGLVATLSLLLGACATEYTYEPPASAEGKACVARCQSRQNACRADEQDRAAEQQHRCKVESARRQEQCEHDAQIDYDACLKYSKTDADRNACKKNACGQDACYSSANYGQCDGDYRVCFQSCGGKIGILK